MHRPNLSIITVCFNAVASLPTCLESVSQQTFTDYEHIVIDGGSTDGTVALLESTESHNLSWVSEPDRGIADAMNKGIARARGEWLLFLQADDRLLGNESLETVSRFLASPAKLLVFDTVIVNSGLEERIWKAEIRRYWRKMPGSHQGMLFRRDWLEQNGAFDISYTVAMDYELVFRMLESGAAATEIHETFSAVSETGLSSKRDWPSLYKRLLEERRIHYTRTRRSLRRFRSRLYWAGYLPYKRLTCESRQS